MNEKDFPWHSTLSNRRISQVKPRGPDRRLELRLSFLNRLLRSLQVYLVRNFEISTPHWSPRFRGDTGCCCIPPPNPTSTASVHSVSTTMVYMTQRAYHDRFSQRACLWGFATHSPGCVLLRSGPDAGALRWREDLIHGRGMGERGPT